MDIKHFTRSLDLLFATTPEEADCDTLQALLPEFVQYELTGRDAATKFPELAGHLIQCADCTQDYFALLDVARLDAQDRLPSAELILKQFPEAERVPQDTENVSEVRSELVRAAGR